MPWPCYNNLLRLSPKMLTFTCTSLVCIFVICNCHAHNPILILQANTANKSPSLLSGCTFTGSSTINFNDSPFSVTYSHQPSDYQEIQRDYRQSSAPTQSGHSQSSVPTNPGGIQSITPAQPDGIQSSTPAQSSGSQSSAPAQSGGIQSNVPCQSGGIQSIAPGGIQSIAPTHPGGIQSSVPVQSGRFQSSAQAQPGGSQPRSASVQPGRLLAHPSQPTVNDSEEMTLESVSVSKSHREDNKDRQLIKEQFVPGCQPRLPSPYAGLKSFDNCTENSKGMF